MKITVHSSKAVKPEYGACGIAPGCTADAVPLTVLDKANFDTYISVIYAFRAPAPPNAVLGAGLARALVHYREWAGRLGVDANGDRAIMLNDAVARFVEATADVPLDSVMPLKPTPEVLSLHPSGDDGPEELMLIQVTRFPCGSLVVGFTTQHIVSDGRSSGNFFVAWSQGHPRCRHRPRPGARPRFLLPAPQSARGRVRAPWRGVQALRESARCCLWCGRRGGGEQGAFQPGVHLQAQVAGFGGRAPAVQHPAVRGGAPVAKHDEGARARRRGDHQRRHRRGRESADEPAGAGWIHRQRRALGAAHHHGGGARGQAGEARGGAHQPGGGPGQRRLLKSFIDFASSGVVEKEPLVATADAAEMVLSPDIEVDSWLRIPFYDMDFGGGRPFFFMPSYLPVEGLLILLPSFLGDGSVDTYVPLFSRDMNTFKNCCYTLDSLEESCSWARM